jgi:3'-phosphoadenosine 5'-phosphosulfate (PAPS) 3'-phosphatase
MSPSDLAAREINYLQPFDHFGEPAEGHSIKVAASLTHFSEQMSSIIKTMEPVEICRMGGAGNKCNNLAIGNVDCYIHPSPGLCYWDLCAPESLVKGMGGYATNLAQERLTYFPDGNRKLKGLILARNPPMYRMIERRMGDMLKNIMSIVKL